LDSTYIQIKILTDPKEFAKGASKHPNANILFAMKKNGSDCSLAYFCESKMVQDKKITKNLEESIFQS